MKSIIVDLFHLFVLFMMLAFVVLCIVAASGEFDHWTNRFTKKQKKVKLQGRRRIAGRVVQK